VNTFTATDPNGQTHTRNSKRPFTHVVFATYANNDWSADGSYYAIGWAGSLELAEKLYRTTLATKHPRSKKLTFDNVTLVNAS
jgi:hypothetical protein